MIRVINVCATIVNISQPFDAGKFVEVKLQLPVCGEVSGGGEVLIRLDAADAGLYTIGNRFMLRLTPI